MEIWGKTREVISTISFCLYCFRTVHRALEKFRIISSLLASLCSSIRSSSFVGINVVVSRISGEIEEDCGTTISWSFFFTSPTDHQYLKRITYGSNNAYILNDVAWISFGKRNTWKWNKNKTSNEVPSSNVSNTSFRSLALSASTSCLKEKQEWNIY